MRFKTEMAFCKKQYCMILYILSIFFILLTVVILIIVGKKTNMASTASIEKPRRIISFKVNYDIKKAMEIVINCTRSSQYKLGDIDYENCIVVLTDVPSANNFGNFFPIYFSEADNQTLIEIGIKNKGIQITIAGFHNDCVNFIKSTFLLEQSNNMPNSDKTKYCTVCGKAYVHDKDKHFCDSCGQKL